MPTKFYGGMEYEQYVQFMQDWVEQDQFRYIGCPACTDTGSTGNVGDVAWYALVGFLMITGLGTVYGAVVAALSGA